MPDLAEPPTVTFPVQRTCPFSLPSEYQQLRAGQPASRVGLAGGRQAWALWRYQDIRAMLVDQRFSSDRRRPGYPILDEEEQDATTATLSMATMDPPEHTAIRRSVISEFTVKRAQAMRPRIQQIVDERVDAMLAGPRPADLVQALSVPVPSLVTCDLLGVPSADHDFFQHRCARMTSLAVPPDERHAVVMEVYSYLDQLVTEKEEHPSDDLLGRTIRKRCDNEFLDHEALVGLAFLLLVAGHETTASMISLGTLILLTHPDQLERIKHNPDAIPGAVEEMLRYFTIGESVNARVALADVEIGGVLIREGEGVVAMTSAADRDPAAFDDPEKFDIERQNVHHLAFGYGPHQCLGQNLARVELHVVFETLFRRIPGLRLAADAQTLPLRNESLVFGVDEVPVSW